uniref:Uncharacterized protein n=1 Tax=Ditylenchus dipsaci TaxID=166011 RepID=A0A915E8K4_9BILA
MTPSPQKAVNDNAIVATTSFSPTTTDAVCPKPQPQQRPATQTGQQPRKRKVVLMPRDPRLQTSHLNGATTSGVAPASRPPTLPITLQTPSSFSPSLAPIPKPVVANHAPAAAQMSSSSSTLATKPAPITLKPTANQSQPTAITNPNKPKRPRIQAPTKDGQQQHKQNATATKGGVSSSSYASATTYSQQQMSAENIQEYLRLASMLPSSSINEQTLAALREFQSRLFRDHYISHQLLHRSLLLPPTTNNMLNLVGARYLTAISTKHTHHWLATSLQVALPLNTSHPPNQDSLLHLDSLHFTFHTSAHPHPHTTAARDSVKTHPRDLLYPLSKLLPQATNLADHLISRLLFASRSKRPKPVKCKKPPLDHTSDNSSSSHINPTSNMQQANLLTQAQLQTHTQALQLEKLQQYLRQQHQQGQQSWMPLLAQQWSQQSSNVPLQSAGTSRKTTPHNGSMEQGLAEIARRFELQKLAFEQRSMKDQAGKRN